MQRLAYGGAAHEPTAAPLEFNRVAVAYNGSGYALHDISFQVDSGEQIAVVGPNGAGKSTLFKLITGILKPDRGTIQMYGHPPDRHVCIAYVPQRSEIDRSFPVTVADVVLMGRTQKIGLFRRPKRRDHEIVQQALERVDAMHLHGNHIRELSGGQQQRVFIARALAQEAELVLLDEPLAGLDLPSQEAIFGILDKLRSDGVTIMVATHDLSMAAQRFDRVMLLNQRIVALGSGTEVVTSENLMIAYGSTHP